MKTIATFFMTFLLATALVQAQGIPNLPSDGLVGHWTFDDAVSLESATVGNDLEQDAHNGADKQFVAVDGPDAGNGAVNVGLGSFYRCFHDIEINGFDPDFPELEPTRVNRYSLVIDFKLPQTGVWYAFHAGDNNAEPGNGDWESFIRPEGRIGVGSTGYSHYLAPEMEWHRLVISADLGNSYVYYLDGQILQYGGERTLDDRFSLDTPDGSNQLLLIGDNDGEDSPIDIAEIVLYDRPLSAGEIAAMGGYGHFISFGESIAGWSFNNPDSLDLPSVPWGKKLNVEGSFSTFPGPSVSDGAIQVPQGSYLVAPHDILVNGAQANPTKANTYSISLDFQVPELGKLYSLFQANPENIDDAELFVDEMGRIGSGEIGWSDTSIAKVLPGEWHRLGFTVSAGHDSMTNVAIYLDGDLIHTKAKVDFDGDLALAPKGAENTMLFFADDNGEDNAVATANIAIFNRYLSEEDVRSLGGYEHSFSTEKTPAINTLDFKVAENTQYAKAPHSEDFDIPRGRDFTVEVWVKVGLGIGGDPSVISNKDWDSGGNNGWNIAAKDDSWDLNIADTTRARNDWDLPSINDGQWHHIGFSLDRQVDSLYVFTDDIKTIKRLLADGDKRLGSSINKDKFPLTFAQDGTENYPDKFPGSIDEVRIWHAALPWETILEWRYKEVTNAHPYRDKLVGYWQFNEGQGNTIKDMSGRGHDAELVNSPRWNVSYAPIGDATAQTTNELTGIWASRPSGHSGGLTLDVNFGGSLFKQILGIEASFTDERYAVFGHNNATGVTDAGLAELASDVEARLSRAWYFDKTATFEETLNVIFSFNAAAGPADNYVLLVSTEENGPFMSQTNATVVNGNDVIFQDIPSVDGGQHMDQLWATIGTKDQNVSPLGDLARIAHNATPFAYSLSTAYPNPFNPTTTIEYSLAKKSDVTLTVFNMLGQQVVQLVNAKALPAGNYSVSWDAGQFPSGVYFYQIKAGDFDRIHKMMLVK